MAPAGILALQEEESDAARDGRPRRHGLAILRELAALQRGLLAGRVGTDGLRRLASLADALPLAADPDLATALEAVSLRARAELARLESRFATST